MRKGSFKREHVAGIHMRDICWHIHDACWHMNGACWHMNGACWHIMNDACWHMHDAYTGKVITLLSV